ncbi:MAG: BMP family ABC transporter substrate-binding protein, partial [Clostridia bacterium]|nr:BMP family ABC transporter substrate-binding protein [Clostridia bacterium]
AKLESGELKVFATDTFTVEGKTLDTYMADVDTDEAYEGDTEVIIDGAFEESKFRSAPYFNVMIDGIETLNAMY